MAPPKTKGIPAEKDVWSKIQTADFLLQSSWDKPTEAQLTYLRQAEELLNQRLQETNQLFKTKVLTFQKTS